MNPTNQVFDKAGNNKKYLEFFFNIIIAYYFLFLLFYDGEAVKFGSLLYLFIVAPILLFSFLSFIHYTVMLPKKIGREQLPLLFFGAFASFFALVKGDFIGSVSIFLFTVVLFSILHARLRYSLVLLNFLYVFSVLLSIPLFHFGMNSYGYIPGMAGSHNLDVLDGRISIFPGVASSLQVSFFIIVINLFFGGKNSKWVMVLLASYFLFFGVSRVLSVLVLFLLILYASTYFFKFRNGVFFKFTIPLLFVFMIVLFSLFLRDIVTYLTTFDFVRLALFRGYANFDDITQDVARFDIWNLHLSVFLSNPFGISSSQILAYSQLTYGGIGSESFITRIFANYGLPSFLFIYFLFIKLIQFVRDGNFFGYFMIWVFLLLGLIYGSSFNIYNVVFLILASSMNFIYKK